MHTETWEDRYNLIPLPDFHGDIYPYREAVKEFIRETLREQKEEIVRDHVDTLTHKTEFPLFETQEPTRDWRDEFLEECGEFILPPQPDGRASCLREIPYVRDRVLAFIEKEKTKSYEEGRDSLAAYNSGKRTGYQAGIQACIEVADDITLEDVLYTEAMAKFITHAKELLK